MLWIGLVVSMLLGMPAFQSQPQAAAQVVEAIQPDLQRKTYLPIIYAKDPPLNTLMGLEINPGYMSRIAQQFGAARVNWVRYNGINWGTIEARRGVRDWSRVSAIEQELRLIAERSTHTMLTVRGAPEWARVIADKGCGPIRPDALDDYVAFVQELVQRYSQPPYNVRYWEFGNEIDAPWSLIDGSAPYGCWGNSTDQYFGGGLYATMLKKVYPAVKAVDPRAQVVFGGLLLDCDPNINPSNCQMGRFLEGALRAGGGNYFDILAYHSYFYWGPVTYDLDLTYDKWRHRGGSLIGKADFLRSVMRQYNVDKPLIMNEGGILCFRSSPDCGPQGYFNDQAIALVKMFARSHQIDLIGTIWYPLNGPGWQESGLLDARQNPRPAYQSLLAVTALLRDATYTGPVAQGIAEGYSFRRGTTLFQIYWTNSAERATITLPPTTRAVYRYDGQRLPLSETISVGREPVIIEFVQPKPE